MKLAYLTNQYPKISHTFIRREIHALEKQGLAVTRFSIRRADETFSDPADQSELVRTEFLLDHGVRAFLQNSVWLALTRPRAFGRALRLAMQMGWHSQRGVMRHGAYLAEACLLQTLCAARGITHLHVHHATNPAAVALLCQMLGGPPYSLTVHGPEEFEHGAQLALPAKILRAKFVVTVSEYGRRELVRWCGENARAKIHVVPNGAEELFCESAPAPAPAAARFLWIGRLEEQKDPLLLVRAMERLRAQHIFCTVTLLGDGPLRPMLEMEIAQRGLSQVMSLRGWANRAEILTQLRAARALVLSSRAENVPGVILEALAQERPVVSTNVGGVSELVADGVTGWLVPPQDADALARAMRAALETDTAQLERMGKSGRRFVLENFDGKKQARALRALFQKAAADSPKEI